MRKLEAKGYHQGFAVSLAATQRVTMPCLLHRCVRVRRVLAQHRTLNEYLMWLLAAMAHHRSYAADHGEA